MKAQAITLSLLVVVTLLVDLVTARLAAGQVWPAPSVVLLYALLFGQVSLLSIWAALGSPHWIWRCAALAAGVAAGTHLLARTVNLSPAAAATVLASQACLVVLASALLVLDGFRWIASTGPRRDHAYARSAARFQFSLGHMMGWTTVIAVLCLTARLARFPSEEQPAIIASLLYSTVVALSAIWLFGIDRRMPIRFAVPLVIALGLAMGMTGFEPASRFSFAMLFAMQALFLCAWLGASASAGYQITRIGQSLASAHPRLREAEG